MTVTYKDSDKATDHLLDFIAGGVPDNPSGESAGNYNATFGHINASDPLSKKSLSDIYEMQSVMLAENGISTATGRYQGLKGTIQAYQQSKGLPNSTMFTEILQDDFGLTKMVDRGYSKWWTRGISDNEFMHRLSMEWASLPDPQNGGKSHYDGDAAGNHASTSLAFFQEALDEARKFIDGDQPTPAPEEPPAPWEPITLPPITDPNIGVEAIQEILVRTGDLPNANEIDGMWGNKSETALRDLLARDKAQG